MDVLQYYVIFEFEAAFISGLLPGFYWEQAFSPRLGSAPSLFTAPPPVGSGYSETQLVINNLWDNLWVIVFDERKFPSTYDPLSRVVQKQRIIIALTTLLIYCCVSFLCFSFYTFSCWKKIFITSHPIDHDNKVFWKDEDVVLPHGYSSSAVFLHLSAPFVATLLQKI